ncbi:MAG: GGDEF domain-containing protein [Gammaproteobacteria bacterium]|nr:GGDEF domain-containing protein [Gammaproteobacteria bacterium]MCP5200915.1 GGDEF domain-containing protein [Gammaproteobacteria bacterium]
MPIAREARGRDPELGEFAHVDLLHDVDPGCARRLLAGCAELAVSTGTRVLEAGADNDAVYLVLDGELEVRLGEADTAPVARIGSGSCVGELSILSRLKVSAHVVATRPSRLLVIPDAVVWEFIGASHEFAANLLRLLSGRVREDNLRLRDSLDAQLRYQRAAKVDAVTGLYNRRWFDEVAARQAQRACTEGVPLSLLFIDIDHFKQVNDRHGHRAGDDALRGVADVLQAGVRPIDVVARFGGEEFATVLYGVNAAEAGQVAERLRRDIAAHALPGAARAVRVTVSVGVAELVPGEGIAELIEACDVAMYAAKGGGRNRVVTRGTIAAVAAAS